LVVPSSVPVLCVQWHHIALWTLLKDVTSLVWRERIAAVRCHYWRYQLTLSGSSFIILFTCSQAWSAPMDTKGVSLFVTDIFPYWSSCQVSGWVLFSSCMSAMYRGQRRLYCIRSMAKKSLFSASPACRCRFRSEFHEDSMKNRMISTRCTAVSNSSLTWTLHWSIFLLPGFSVAEWLIHQLGFQGFESIVHWQYWCLLGSFY